MLRHLLVAAVLLVAGPIAAAEPVVVLDLAAEADAHDEAQALSLLLRAGLAAGDDSPVVGDRKLQAAIAGVRPQAAPTPLLLPPGQHAALLTQLGASRLVFGAVRRRGHHLTASLIISDKTVRDAAGWQPRRIRATEAASNLCALGHTLAQRTAEALGLAPPTLPAGCSFGELLPLVRARRAWLANQEATAADLMLSASPELGRQLAAPLRELGQALLQQADLSLEQRVLPAVILGADKAAFAPLEQLLADTPAGARGKTRRGELLGVKALAHDVLGQKPEATVLAGKLRRNTSEAAQLARAKSYERHGQQRRHDAVVAELLADGYLPALAPFSRLDPGKMSAPLLLAAHKGAAGLDRGDYAALHARLALGRAVQAEQLDASPAEQLAELRTELFGPTQLAAADEVASGLSKVEGAAGHALRGALLVARGDYVAAEVALSDAVRLDPEAGQTRLLLGRSLVTNGKHAAAIALLEDNPTADPRAGATLVRALELQGETQRARDLRQKLDRSQPRTSGASTRELLLDRTASDASQAPADEQPPHEALLAQTQSWLTELLARNPRRLSAIGLLPLAGPTQWPIWPVRTRPALLAATLGQSLRGPPFSLEVMRGITEPLEQLATQALARSCDELGVEGLVLYRLAARGLSTAELRLVLFDRQTRKAYELEHAVAGRPLGLLGLNLPLLLGLGCLALVGCALLLRRTRRGSGRIEVQIVLDATTTRHAFTVLVSRSPTPPPITDPQAYSDRVLTGGVRRRRLSASGVYRRAWFDRVPAGPRHVQLIGTFVKELKLQLLEPLSQPIEVVKDGTVAITFDLDPKTFALTVRLFDGEQPVPGGEVWLEGGGQEPLETDAQGCAVLQVPRHTHHVLQLRLGDVQVQREVQQAASKSRSLTINLERERQVSSLADGIELELASPAPGSEATPLWGTPPSAAPTPNPQHAPQDSASGLWLGELDLPPAKIETPDSEPPATADDPPAALATAQPRVAPQAPASADPLAQTAAAMAAPAARAAASRTMLRVSPSTASPACSTATPAPPTPTPAAPAPAAAVPTPASAVPTPAPAADPAVEQPRCEATHELPPPAPQTARGVPRVETSDPAPAPTNPAQASDAPATPDANATLLGRRPDLMAGTDQPAPTEKSTAGKTVMGWLEQDAAKGPRDKLPPR